MAVVPTALLLNDGVTHTNPMTSLRELGSFGEIMTKSEFTIQKVSKVGMSTSIFIHQTFMK